MSDPASNLTIPPNQQGASPLQSPPPDYNRAVQLHSAGQLAQSEQILRQILQRQPGHAHALHLLGVIAHQVGKTDQALALIEKATQLNPNVSLFYSNLAEMNRLKKNLDKAIECGKKATKLDPNNAEAHSNLGIAYFDNKDLDNAEKQQQAALAISPNLLPALNNMGSIMRNRKDRDAAMQYYRQVLSINPNHLESINNLGAVLNESEEAEQAVQTLLRAVKMKPDYAEAHCNLGNAFMGLENLDKAAIGYQQAIKFKPDYAEAYDGLARVHKEKNELDAAEAMVRKSLELSPDRAEAHSMLGVIYTEQGFPEKAEQEFDQALQLNPELSIAHIGKGHLEMQLGDMKAAENSFKNALELEPDSIGPRLSLTMVHKAKEGDENMAELIKEAKDVKDMPEPKAMSLHFALGKCYEDTKQYDESFPHYLEACRLKRKRIDYDATQSAASFERIKNFFTKERVADLSGGGDASNLPIVIVGMPRSGTTLTEQIIASHPLVHGAGELPDLMKIANIPDGPNAKCGYPESLEGFTATRLADLGQRYAAGLHERNPQATHVTDKMPANFLALGMLRLMLPNVRIIHINRSPLDTCVSNFTRLFNTGQFHSYDLAELGQYYRCYHDLMAHWRTVLPPGAFMDLHYEELVSDPEAQTRQLIDFCQLEWNDACLSPHKTKRSIRTASVTQVREPVYTSSIERWRRYEKHLGPLIEALGDLAK